MLKILEEYLFTLLQGTIICAILADGVLSGADMLGLVLFIDLRP